MREYRLSVADKGWSWVVMAGSFGAHMIAGSFQCAVGVIHNAILERFNEDVGKTSWASSVYLGMLSVIGVLASALINLYSCRVTMFIGAFLMTTGFVICALVPSLDLFIIFFGGLGGIGTGLTYAASVVILGFNFRQNRNIACGIAVSGAGVGTLVLTPVIEAAREEYGNSGFFFIIAGIAFHQAFFGFLFFPSELESEQKESRHRNTISKHKHAVVNNVLHSIAILKNIPMLCICISMFFACAGVYLMYVLFPNYVIQMGSSSLDASFLLSVSGVFDCIGRFLTGIVAHDENIDELVIYFGSFGVLGLSTLLFPLYGSTYGGQLAYAVFLGLYSGSCYSVINTLIVQLVGLKELATGFGACLFFCGVGSLLGPPAAGSCITTAAVLGLAVAYCKKPEEAFAANNPEIPTVSKTVTTE
ncbi:Monocarboxylate transporter 12 [Mizuhopecten yessoensis]|uniref:Monocarboxylate transporter 12 n=1 Tax=Mizuhopecten yessoensis TaxID=6573 RepID=A0A210PYC3_MIZYE|nr:Monocarboxylate transporter 12 [Mizuhopecten yessoensis]